MKILPFKKNTIIAHATPVPEPLCQDRLARIRAGLEKINRLMAELKAMSKEQDHGET